MVRFLFVPYPLDTAVLYRHWHQELWERVMGHEPEQNPVLPEMPVPIERLLTGLWHQREDLGLIADELLEIFKQHGLTPPNEQ
jgi:hypothetical protein